MDSEYHFLSDYDRWLHTAFTQISMGGDEHVIHGFHITGVGQRLSSILAKHSAMSFAMGQADADEDCKRLKVRKLADLPRIIFSAGKDFTPQDAIKVLQNRSIALAGDVESSIVSQVKAVLLGHLTGELTRPQAEQQIADLLQTNMNRASLIVTTETTYAYNHGRLMQYRGNGVDYVQYRAVMDGRTCSICSSRNGLIAPIDEIGADTPPVHGRCRCVLSPVFSSLQPQLMTPEALDWSNVAPLPKGWVSDDVSKASGRVFDAVKPHNANALINYDKVIIDRNKITGYTLNKLHPVGTHKALLIDRLLGYNESNSDDFIRFIRKQLPNFPAKEKSSNTYGTMYEVVMVVPDLKGRPVKLVTAWNVDSGADPRFKYTGVPRYISAYIKK
ncbi:minor capsid protein [Desulfosporosinus acididurans]|nr:minor capsid protein [Desulfosporosinus acididurans]